jgi:hypothetical protein
MEFGHPGRECGREERGLHAFEGALQCGFILDIPANDFDIAGGNA